MNKKKKQPVKKVHGSLLTVVLVIMAIHGIFAAFLYSSMSTAPEVQRPWIISLMVLHSVANIVAAVGIFYWKKWALYIYGGSTIVALVAGLISVGTSSVFYMILPLAIDGWILRSKMQYFD
jgi:lipoprotein signal peptidase